MIDHEGTITPIIPNIKLITNWQRILRPPPQYWRFLFLKGGLANNYPSSPGDMVKYKLFKRPPVLGRRRF